MPNEIRYTYCLPSVKLNTGFLFGKRYIAEIILPDMETRPPFPLLSYTSLKELVKMGEGKYLEFKRKARHPEKILKEISAFANSEGGLLLVGVDDNLTIPGVESADEEEFIILDSIAKFLEPTIQVELQHFRLPDDNYVVAFNIPEGTQKPYLVKANEYVNEARAYIRLGDQSIQASKEMRELLKTQKKAKNLRFEFGNKERALMDWLTENKQITVSAFSEIAQIPKKMASRTLVLLTACQVLQIVPQDGMEEDLFVRK